MAVAGLHNIEKVVPVLRRLGEKHARMGKGIGAPEFELMGAQLIVTLKQILGDEFTPEIETAWVETFDIISKTMQAGIEEETIRMS